MYLFQAKGYGQNNLGKVMLAGTIAAPVWNNYLHSLSDCGQVMTM